MARVYDLLLRAKKAEKSTSKEMESLKNEIEKMGIRKAKDLLETHFELSRAKVATNKPINSIWAIGIRFNDKPIERCSITYNDVKLPWEDESEELYYEKFIDRFSFDYARVPKGIENENAKVVVMNGDKILGENIFKNIPEECDPRKR